MPRRRLLPGWPSFLSALLLALAVSTSLVQQRLSHGAPASLLWSLALLPAAMLVWRTAGRRDVLHHVLAQLAGATCGTVFVHLTLVHGDAALVESGRQFTNDAVLVLSILGAVWTLKLERRAVLLVLTPSVLLAGYHATAGWWHVDHFPGSTVQDFVLREALAVLLGLLVFDLLWAQRGTPS